MDPLNEIWPFASFHHNFGCPLKVHDHQPDWDVLRTIKTTMAEDRSTVSDNIMAAESNDFYFEDPSDASTASKPEHPATNRSPNRLNRGSLISGIMPTSSNNGETSQSEDIESCMEPPDSDFASRAPHTVWQPSTISSSGSDDPTRQHTEPAVKDDKLQLNNNDKRKTRLLVGLGLAVVVLLGAIGAVTFLMFGNNSGDAPEAARSRTEIMTEAISKVSNATDLENPESAQSKAQSWLIDVDVLWMGEESTIPEMRIIQRYALAVFYFATNGPAAWRENNWMEGDECGSVTWDYIECNENSELRAIALDGMGLQGSIPSEVASLAMLENFVLKNERGLGGSIPPALGKLANLKQLGLYYAGIKGKIPVELFNATSLKYVNFQDNGLTGGIPSEIEALSSLETLVLMANQFSGEIPWQSLVATGVQFLGLSNNMFAGGIPAVVQDFPDLRYLYLDHNNMSGTVPEALGNLTTLRSINFDHNDLSGNLPSSIGNLGSLEYLSMQYNRFDGPLPTDLGRLFKLKTLSLGANNFTGSLPAFTAMPDLKNIYIFENGLNGSIPESLFQLESLEMLFLSSNKLNGEIPSFPAGQLQNRLRGLYLSDNQLEGQIPESVCDLKYLESLFLDENQLSGFLPRCLGRLTKLTQLYAFKNELYGNVPEEFSRLEELVELGIEENNMTGVVPDDVCALSDEQSISFWADCNGPDTSLECPCCTVCCPASEECA